MAESRQAFPLGLTVATVIVIAICSALGVWQLRRAMWKKAELARIAALAGAPAQPIGPVLARAARGQDVSFTRVSADCLIRAVPQASPPPLESMKIVAEHGEWIARLVGDCRLEGAVFDGIEIDRGLVPDTRGSTDPRPTPAPTPAHVVGVLVPVPEPNPGRAVFRNPAPYELYAEHEAPAPPSVRPAPPTREQVTANLQYVGAYAPTWFGLAGVAACVYAAMLWRRYRPKA